jgi:hypothetical protein
VQAPEAPNRSNEARVREVAERLGEEKRRRKILSRAKAKYQIVPGVEGLRSSF